MWRCSRGWCAWSDIQSWLVTNCVACRRGECQGEKRGVECRSRVKRLAPPRGAANRRGQVGQTQPRATAEFECIRSVRARRLGSVWLLQHCAAFVSLPRLFGCLVCHRPEGVCGCSVLLKPCSSALFNGSARSRQSAPSCTCIASSPARLRFVGHPSACNRRSRFRLL